MNSNDHMQLIAGVNDRIPFGRAFVLGLQHVLSMDLYIMPLILGAVIGLQGADLSYFLQMSFLACGLATLIQAGLFMKFPIVQGPSYVPLAALCMVGSTMGIPVMIGSLIPGALLVIALGMCKGFSRFIRKAIPPFIGGIIILIVGLTLVPTAITGVFSTDGDLTANAVSGCVAFLVLLVCMVLQYRFPDVKGLHMCSVILALVAGTVIAVGMGAADFSQVSSAAWFSLPQPFHFGVPQFNVQACLLMAFLYFFILLDATGTWFTITAITGEELDDRRIDKATIGEGLGCLVGALFGGTPMTGYSSNAGLIAITRVASRRAILAGGVLLAAMGFCPKLMALITAIPTPVINGIFAVVCMTLISNSLHMIKTAVLDERTMMILGASVVCGVSTMILPDDVVAAAPAFLQYFLSSGIAIGGTVAILLQLVLPKCSKERQRHAADATQDMTMIAQESAAA
ncbi:uracil-xanthine permease family protein [Bifidobacterium cuniculi]|uniref:Xanthine/uracil permease n=1 Tax=Bifidobacterium cuniculi TaxID=1688 RepID=A0A087AX73_9BIFI|nr:solute carrier family 23 protein [Bifidobacterium cuniculi]KFI63373.1 Xanthine/uracil permease [Bifidobacterium cuniculi]